MRGEGVFRDRTQNRTLRGKRTLNGCKMKKNLDNVVIIDVDCERVDNVIFIDAPESLQCKRRGSRALRKGKKFKLRGVISIDDDDDDADAYYPNMGRDHGGDLESDTSSSKRCPTFDYRNKSVDLNDDECHVVQENNSAFRVSKGKQAFGKEPCVSRYGLSESSSSDDDGSDCEVMEGSSGQLRKEWEKASLKRKSNVRKGKCGLDDQASPSCLNNDGTPNVDAKVGERDELPLNTAVFYDTYNSDYEKQNFSTFVPTVDEDLGTASLNHGMKCPFVKSDRKVDHKASQASDEARAECGGAVSVNNVGAAFEESFSLKTCPSGMPELCNETADQQDTEKPDAKVVSSCKTHCAETETKPGNPCLAEIKGQGGSAHDQIDNEVDPIHDQGVSFTPAVGEDIINKREKFKETDEYKRAMEEEWASRQWQLQIQAEESQRLLKKKRAESMRLLDMERRQKQRLEEIRETQKKDEENMNLKEQLRVEVQKELYKLEMTCIDMASLLRALGIHVGGSFHPLSEEVHAAYKRALLRFHPDRASKSDIRQQVEAEEKFKLISRMKEKFLLTTCN